MLKLPYSKGMCCALRLALSGRCGNMALIAGNYGCYTCAVVALGCEANGHVVVTVTVVPDLKVEPSGTSPDTEGRV